ncbi:MAG: DUF1669 domain-containing protein [Gammaproteobacteria bacterium]|nr:DUF1669 domain-containing protein [Gammaproteobacteria bacterium]
MEVKAYFANIHKVIIKQLETADSRIVAAVAWFTDSDIFDVLCKKAQQGVQVSIVLIEDEINQGVGRLNFNRLKNLGGSVTFVPASGYDTPTMHHKFCVIDNKTVITGSYNWSKKARSNDENITILYDSEKFALQYLDVFQELTARVDGDIPSSSINTDSIKRRLEMIRNLILLDEHEDISLQIKKLSPFSEQLKLGSIIDSLNQGLYQNALEQINHFLSKFTALVSVEAQEIPRLQFQLQVLELRLESLSNEKTEIERCLIVFNRRYDEMLGDAIQELLKTRVSFANLVTELKKKNLEQELFQTDDAEEEVRVAIEEADAAENTYRQYSKQHEQLQHEAPVPELDKEQEKELKSLYRKACNLCHPDKVPEDKKEFAHEVFIALQDAYKNNDLKQINQIYERISTGDFSQTRATTLSKVEVLTSAIAEIKYRMAQLISELQLLQHSEAVRLMQSAGKDEEEWHGYFIRQNQHLDAELAKLSTQIQQLQQQLKDGAA